MPTTTTFQYPADYRYRRDTRTDSRRLASYMAAMGNVNRGFGQQLNQAQQLGAEAASRYGLTGPEAATFARKGLAEVIASRERAATGLGQTYLQEETAAGEAERQREFENLSQLMATYGQYADLGGGKSAFQLGEEAAANRAYLDYLIQRKLIRAQQEGTGFFTPEEAATLEAYGISPYVVSDQPPARRTQTGTTPEPMGRGSYNGEIRVGADGRQYRWTFTDGLQGHWSPL